MLVAGPGGCGEQPRGVCGSQGCKELLWLVIGVLGRPSLRGLVGVGTQAMHKLCVEEGMVVRLPSNVYGLAKRIQREEAQAIGETGRSPTLEELATALQVSPEQVRTTQQACARLSPSRILRYDMAMLQLARGSNTCCFPGAYCLLALCPLRPYDALLAFPLDAVIAFQPEVMMAFFDVVAVLAALVFSSERMRCCFGLPHQGVLSLAAEAGIFWWFG